jgi:hypothetical protein
MEISMNRISFKGLITAALIGALGQMALSAPAYAGSWISMNVAPSDSGDAGMLSSGLQLYGLYRNFKDGNIEQMGRNNSAGLSQNGRGNLGIIRQQGSEHAATLQQDGNDNAYGIFQFGRGSQVHVRQNGNNRSGATVSYGW